MNAILSFLLLLATFVATPVWAAPEKIRLFTYHNHPPFVTGDRQGLSFDLGKHLNKKAPDRYLFEVTILPRNRLNVYLANWIQGKCPSATKACKNSWALLWVNPKWGFGNNPEKLLSWIRMVDDSNSIISSASKKVAYKNPDSLIGHRFGGVMGHKYLGIDSLVKKGKIVRIDGNSERNNIFKLLKKRIDVTLLPTSTIHYYLLEGKEFAKFSKDIHIAQTKHQSYSRNFMFPPNRIDLKEIFKKLDSDSAWQATIKSYGFK